MSIRQELESLGELELLDIADNYYSASDYLIRALKVQASGQYTRILTSKMSYFDITWLKKPLKYPIIERSCPVCSIVFKTPNGGSEERTTCGRSCSNTYFRSGKNNPNYIDGATKYRTKAFSLLPNKCNRCSIDDMDVLIVHHKDRNRKNSDISNLEILCANCHMKEHKNSH